MIKLRLWGEPSELAELTKHIKSDERVSVLKVSNQYQYKGKSYNVRVYMDVVLIDDGAVDKPKTKLISRGAGHEES